MRCGQIRKFDVANRPGTWCSVFVTGCPLKCLGCFKKNINTELAGEVWRKKEAKETKKAAFVEIFNLKHLV